MDTECVIDYWLCKFDTGETFQMLPGHPLDIAGLRKTLSQYTVITFNGIHYDMPIVALALAGCTNEQLKMANDMIIVQQMRHWDVLKQFGVAPLDWVDHIDMFDVAPGQGSLKAYMGKMHSKKLQELPFDPNARFEWHDRLFARVYCDNDLDGTRGLFNTFQTQLKLREEMGAEYGVDLRSKSDAQIAEAVMRSILPFKVEVPHILAGFQFIYRPPEWLKFTTPQLQHILQRIATSPFCVTPTGGVSPAHDMSLVDWGSEQVRLDAHNVFVGRPKDWQHEVVRIGETNYAMGMGGLHSMESRVIYREDADHSISSPDVAAYYPSLIVRLGIYPKQIGPLFLTKYTEWKQQRDAAKAAKNKKIANSRKTLNNGTFGKLNSKYSIFYAPTELIQVTITGQLGLFMLIEALEQSGISVISANTDGLVIRCRRYMEPVRDSVIQWWESVTGFVMEMTNFSVLAARDVNSYVAITTDGDVKLKGAFAPPEPGASGWPNPTGQVCVDAIVAWLQHGTPLADTIRKCTDIRQFVHVRSVKGGGSYLASGQLPKTCTLTAMRTALTQHGVPFDAGLGNDNLRVMYSELRDSALAKSEYLGKVVRWYYGVGSTGCIVTSTGGLVARTEGCVPCMELPDVLPADIDYAWYEAEARSMLTDIGVIDYHA
jgi:hypothetical protein